MQPGAPDLATAKSSSATCSGQFRPLHRALQDAALVGQGEDLKLKGYAAAKGGRQGRKHGCEYAGGGESTEKGQLQLYQTDRGFRERQVGGL